MPEPVRDAASLAPVLFQRDYPEHIVQVLAPCEVERHIDSLVPTPVVDDDYLISARDLPCACSTQPCSGCRTAAPKHSPVVGRRRSRATLLLCLRRPSKAGV